MTFSESSGEFPKMTDLLIIFITRNQIPREIRVRFNLEPNDYGLYGLELWDKPVIAAASGKNSSCLRRRHSEEIPETTGDVPLGGGIRVL